MTNPGFGIAVSKNGFEYLAQVGASILETQLKNIKIPEAHGNGDNPIGTLHWKLTDILLREIRIPKAVITTSNTEIRVSAAGINLSGEAHWKYRTSVIYIPVYDSVTVDINVSINGLVLEARIGRNAQGQAILSSLKYDYNIGHLGVDLHSGASWLYNIIYGFVKGKIQKSLNDQVRELAESKIDKLNLVLEKRIDKTGIFDYSLVRDPVFTTQYMATEHKGELRSPSQPQEFSFSPFPLPAIQKTDRMLYIWMSTYIANTAVATYQKAGMLQMRITPELIPPNSPIQLNTTTFKHIIPALCEKFPSMNMTVFIHATQPPILTVDPHFINVTVYGDVDVYVYDKDKGNEITPALNLSVIVNTHGTIGVKVKGGKHFLTGKANFLETKFTVKSSWIGDVNADTLQNMVNFFCDIFAIKEFNKYALEGLEIPLMDGMQLVSPQITLRDGFIVVETDISYNPRLFSGEKQLQPKTEL